MDCIGFQRKAVFHKDNLVDDTIQNDKRHKQSEMENINLIIADSHLFSSFKFIEAKESIDIYCRVYRILEGGLNFTSLKILDGMKISGIKILSINDTICGYWLLKASLRWGLVL